MPAPDELDAVIRRAPVSRLVFRRTARRLRRHRRSSVEQRREAAGTEVHCVDISADFRYASPAAYEAVYKHAHGAPARIREFTCAIPEHLAKSPTPHVAHPGCFATATLLASVPLLALGLTDTRLFVTGITGSTGSGRKPVEGTHHPHRHSDLYATARSVIAMSRRSRLARSWRRGVEAQFNFVPHSGPFARGIHVTVQASPKNPITTAQALEALQCVLHRLPLRAGRRERRRASRTWRPAITPT